MISQGASEIKYVATARRLSHMHPLTLRSLASTCSISSVIDGRDAVKALNLVHHKLLSSSASTVSAVGPWMI